MEKNTNTLCQVSKVHTIRQHPPPPQDQTRDCYDYGGKHNASVCHFKDAMRHSCKKPGYVARMWLAKVKHPREREAVDKSKPHVRTHWFHPDKEHEDVYTLFHLGEKNKIPYLVELSVNDAPLCMEVDTGAAVSFIKEATYRSLGDPPPQQII